MNEFHTFLPSLFSYFIYCISIWNEFSFLRKFSSKKKEWKKYHFMKKLIAKFFFFRKNPFFFRLLFASLTNEQRLLRKIVIIIKAKDRYNDLNRKFSLIITIIAHFKVKS